MSDVVVTGVGPQPAANFHAMGDPPGDVNSSPSPPAVTISDPTAIDLDQWATGPPWTGTDRFTVFDLDRLSAGWTVAGSAGYHFVNDLDPTHYQWAATVRTGNDRVVYLSAEVSDAPGAAPGGTDASVHDQPAVVDSGTISWTDPAGVGLTVSSPDATPSELVELANVLPVATIDRLTMPDNVFDDGSAAPGTVRLAGTLDAQRWEIRSADDATESSSSLSVNVEEHFNSSYSRPTVELRSTWDLSVTGVGDHGVLLYGLAPGEIATVHVNIDNGPAISIPVAHDATGLAVYAVPLPAGLRVRNIDLVDVDGTIVHTFRPPPFLTPAVGTDAELDRRAPTTHRRPRRVRFEGVKVNVADDFLTLRNRAAAADPSAPNDGRPNVRRWVDDILPLLVDDDPLGVDTFATHPVPLSEASAAYSTFQTTSDGAIKVV